jgi:DNA repair photolyase
VPDIEKRFRLYKELKKEGFRVGIRIQPFIPDVSTLEIVKMFSDADQFTLEGIKLVPQNKEHKELVLQALDMEQSSFTQMGLLNLKPHIRLEMYRPFIEYFETHGIPFSIADNDMHHIGTNHCCCGDRLVTKSTTFNNTAMCQMYGKCYAKEQLDYELFESGVRDCKCNQLFTSNRQEGCTSVQDFYDKRFYRKSSPFSPSFLLDEEDVCEVV